MPLFLNHTTCIRASDGPSGSTALPEASSGIDVGAAGGSAEVGGSFTVPMGGGTTGAGGGGGIGKSFVTEY